MATFEKGDKVIHVSTKEKGIIVAIGACGRGGRQVYTVNFNGVETYEFESNLMSDLNIDDPFECCRANIFGSFKDFSKINTTFKIKNTNISTVSSLKASKTLFRAYQFKPLLKFLNSDNKRILVADEVGLGKTIEAGHIILELKARNEFRNALVVCPRSLQDKWKEELKEKFGVTFTIVESTKELIRMLTDHNGTTRAIINYEKIRSKTDNNTGEEKNALLKYLVENTRKFSLFLCDEAHKMRNDDTQTYKGALRLMETADAAVFLTATPIMISERNLYNLLHLLDNQRYSNYDIFEQGLRENAPFVRALSSLNSKMSLKEIAFNLENYEINVQQIINDRVYKEIVIAKEHFENFPLFERIINRMKNEEDTLALRSELQYDILCMSQMNQIFSRTRKKEVTTDWSQAVRHPYPYMITLHKDEQEEFDKIIENYIDDNSYENWWGEKKLTTGGGLGLVQMKRQVASSVYAYLNDLEKLIAGKDAYEDKPDAKVEALLKIIDEVFRNGRKKLIVFALFRKTIHYLAIRLKKAGFNCAMIHGGIENRQEVINDFKNNPNIHILLSLEVGSEGLDMQFCDSMVNYDLPWNPMVVEQRIGRIDRFGQESPIVHIYNMIVKDSIQEDIYLRLLDRIGVFRESIGEMEAILDSELETGRVDKTMSLQAMYSNMEREFFSKNLSREERQRKIDEIAQAFENEKQNLHKIEEGLTNTLTNDAYFRNEINRILENNAYVTEQELKNYLEMLLKEHLTTCQLEDIGNGIYELVQPKSKTNILSNFLSANEPHGEDNVVLFRQFLYDIRDLQTIRVTFNQDVAYKNRDVIFLNLYNPIILAALEFFSKNDDTAKRTFRFDVDKNKINLPIERGSYFLAIYQVETSKSIFGTQKFSHSLFPILFDFHNGCIINNRDLTASFYGKLQLHGDYQRGDVTSNLDGDLLSEMQIEFTQAINDYRTEYTDELKLQAINSSMMLRQQTEAFYKYRITNMERTITEDEERIELAKYTGDEKSLRNAESALRLHRGNLRNLERELEVELARVSQDQNLTVRTNLLSLNFVNVI